MISIMGRALNQAHLEQRSFEPLWQSADHWQPADHWPEVGQAEGFVWILCTALESHVCNLASLLVVASLWLFATRNATSRYGEALPHARRLWRPLVPALTLLACVAFQRWTVEALVAEVSLAWRRVCEGLETLTAPSYCRGTLAAGWQPEAEPSEELEEPVEFLAPSESLAPAVSLTPGPCETLMPFVGRETLTGILPQGSEVTQEARPRSRLARCLRGGAEVAFLGIVCVLF